MPFQKRASRLAATRRRYSAVERMSSIGAISSRSVCCASAIDAPAASAASVRVARTTVGADAAKRDRAAGRRPTRGDDDLRDRLGRARPDFAEPLPPANRRDLERDDQLVRAADGLPVAGVERGERHPPRAAGAFQDDDGVGRGEHRQRIARRRGIGDVAADRAAVLNLHAADFARGGRQHRQAPAGRAAIGSDRCASRARRSTAGRRAPRSSASAASRHRFRNRVSFNVPKFSDTYRSVHPAIGDERPLVAQHLQRVGERLRLEQRAMRDQSSGIESITSNRQMRGIEIARSDHDRTFPVSVLRDLCVPLRFMPFVAASIER